MVRTWKLKPRKSPLETSTNISGLNQNDNSNGNSQKTVAAEKVFLRISKHSSPLHYDSEKGESAQSQPRYQSILVGLQMIQWNCWEGSLIAMM